MSVWIHPALLFVWTLFETHVDGLRSQLHDFALTSTDANLESLNEIVYDFKTNVRAEHANQVWFIVRPDLMWNVERGFRNSEFEMPWTPEPFKIRA